MILAIAMLLGLGVIIHFRTMLERPYCPKCPHCRDEEARKREEQRKLNDEYWNRRTRF